MAAEAIQAELNGITDDGSSRTKRGSRFVFTIHGYCQADVEWFKTQTEHNMLVAAEEVGSEEETPHIQGAIAVTKPRSFLQMKAWWDTRYEGANQDCKLWVRNMKGTLKQSLKYCSKENVPIIAYNRLHQGVRQDIIDLVKSIDDGATFVELMNDPEHCLPAAKFTKFTERMIAEAGEKAATEERSIVVQVIYGDTGTGKTAGVKKAFRGNYYELSLASSGTVWFDGYAGEEVLLVDGFDGSKLKYSELIGLLNHGKKRLNIKGSYTLAKWKKVIITSNVHPSAWYSGDTVPNQESLKRRVTETVGTWRLTEGMNFAKVSWYLDEEVKTKAEFIEALRLTAMPSQASEEAKARIARVRARKLAMSVET